MSVRSKGQRWRCDGCGLHAELCLCAEMPRIALDTRVVVVQHAAERFKPTSTARLVLRVFPNSILVVYGAAEKGFATEEITGSDHLGALLFPGPEAHPLGAVGDPRGSAALIVLDGTWSQCSRMARRIPVLRSMPRFTLPPAPPSPWSVRHSADPARLCTFEATLRALSICEGPSTDFVEAERCFQRITARALFMRSRLRRPETPADWTLHLLEPQGS